MRAFHIIIYADASTEPKRVDFHAESPDHAFQIARNEQEGVHVELWEHDRRLASMTKSGSGMWKLHGPIDRTTDSGGSAVL
ncbi:MAG: hypothetical protein ACTHJU_14950 [Sphingopyxis sp.]